MKRLTLCLALALSLLLPPAAFAVPKRQSAVTLADPHALDARRYGAKGNGTADRLK